MGRRFVIAAGLAIVLAVPVLAQQGGDPVVVQPGAPGEASKKLPSDTKAKLPPTSEKDVEFMQGMIVHHAQAVEMVALMADRTTNEDLLRLGSRISQSQADEIAFMKGWLVKRGESVEPSMSGMDMSGKDKKMDMKGDDHAGHDMPKKEMDMSGGHMSGHHDMPGMLTPKQMEELAAAEGSEFDRLFLEGMIQHHIGALVMVKDLFAAPGAGQDADLFTFATEVDSGQRAEIRLMQNMLGRSQENNQ